MKPKFKYVYPIRFPIRYNCNIYPPWEVGLEQEEMEKGRHGLQSCSQDWVLSVHYCSGLLAFQGLEMGWVGLLETCY